MEQLTKAHQSVNREIAKTVIGQEEVAGLLFLTLLCNGHSLLLGVPGVGKTLLSASLARALNLEFQRVQFTPDMMPSDITGSEILESDGRGRFDRTVIQGPVFTNILLADEINRTPPKTQASLLQAMQEREVTIGRETFPLAPPFLVLATQNPLEMEGTYPLPEAQLDRFFSCIKVSYPTPEEELAIATTGPAANLDSIKTVLNGGDIIELQSAVKEVPLSEDVARYGIRLVNATRPGTPHALAPVTDYLVCGGSPRASQALLLAGKARALLKGRVHVDFEDLRSLAGPILRHRLVLNFRARAESLDADDLVNTLLSEVTP